MVDEKGDVSTEGTAEGSTPAPESLSTSQKPSESTVVDGIKTQESSGTATDERGDRGGQADEGLGNDTGIVPTSKKQMKRDRKRAYFLEKRKEKRVQEKARKRAQRAAIREAGGVPPAKRSKKTLMRDSECRQRICVDLAYDKLMTERQISGTISQLAFCYAANRRVANPVQLAFVNFTQVTRTMFFSNPCRQGWDVNIDEQSLCEAYNKEDIVYLTADSDNVLETLDDSKVYVIGGLLDHNSLKGLCLDMAVKHGVAHARLPIDDYVKMRTRKVLTINQVFEILLRYTEIKSWKDAFEEVIPSRRLADEAKNDGADVGMAEGLEGEDVTASDEKEDSEVPNAEEKNRKEDKLGNGVIKPNGNGMEGQGRTKKVMLSPKTELVETVDKAGIKWMKLEDTQGNTAKLDGDGVEVKGRTEEVMLSPDAKLIETVDKPAES